MALELRPSGKIAVGVVGAAAVIGVLHFAVFRGSAAEYQAAYDSYQNTVNQYTSAGATQPIESINKFRYETLSYKQKYFETVQNLRLPFPPEYSFDPKLTNVEKQQQDIWDFMAKIEELRADGRSGKGPKLTFLEPAAPGRARGWDLVESVPKALVQAGIAIEDKVDSLRNEDKLLRSLDPNSSTFRQHTGIYTAQLKELGLDPDAQKAIRSNFGILVGTLYTLNRIDQVMRKLPEDYWSLKDLKARREEMYSLFKIEWPMDPVHKVPIYFSTMRQSQALLDIIRVAKEEGIEEISRVRMHDPRTINYREPAAAAAGQNPGAQPGGMTDEGGPEQPRGRWDTPKPAAGENVGSGSPLEIDVVANNATLMAFLYRLANEKLPFEVDSIRLAAPLKDEGRLQARVFVNVITLTSATGLMLVDDAAKEYVETTRQLADLALKPGARDIAEKEGLVAKEGNTYRLLKPSPTPWPTPAETPVPADQPPPQ